MITALTRRLAGSRLVQIVFFVALAIMLVLFIIPTPQSAQHVSDKLVHVLVFAGLGTLGVFGWPARQRVIGVGLLLVGYGLTVELIQWFMPWRSLEWMDILVNCIGTLVGVTLTWLLVARTGIPPALR